MRHHAKSSRVITLPGNHAGLFVRPAVNELAGGCKLSLKSPQAVRGTDAGHELAGAISTLISGAIFTD